MISRLSSRSLTLVTATLAIAGSAGCRESRANPAPSEHAAADSDLRAALADTTDWPSYGRDYTNQRFSKLTQVNAANVGQLQLAWHYANGIVSALETNPIVIHGTMYITTPLNHVVALDAATGARKWEYVHDYRTTADCCGPINRGVAVYGGRVFMGTVDARLVALDEKTGKVDWTAVVGDNEQGYHITGAPIAIDGKVITGVSCGEQGGRCYVSAYDAATGDLVWRWYTIPDPAHGGWWGSWKTTDPFGTPLPRDIAAEKRDSAAYPDAWEHGGAPMWMTAAADPVAGMLYMAVGNPAPDVDGRVRPGDNLYSDCLVALDVKTGALKWYFQEVSHDLWDYDPAAPVVLVDVKDAAGKIVPAVAQAGKTAWVYVVDRMTGVPIRRSDAFAPQQNMFRVPDEQGLVIAPSTLGGSDWSPTAFDPSLGYLFVDGNYFPQLYRRNHEALEPPAQYWGGVVVAPPSGQYGQYSAVDLNTGRIAWQVHLAKPTISGSMATAGGVVFTGLSDSAFVAFDSKTGKELWRYRAAAGVNAPPITYSINGRQFIAVAAGGNLPLNSARGDELLVFALPSTGGH